MDDDQDDDKSRAEKTMETGFMSDPLIPPLKACGDEGPTDAPEGVQKAGETLRAIRSPRRYHRSP